MRSFKDTNGVEWKIAVNVLTIKRVHADTGVRLDEIFDGKESVQEFLSDQVAFADVMASLLRPQIVERKMIADDLLVAMDDSTIEAASDALIEEVADFFREPRRTMLRELLAKMRQAAAKMREDAVAVARQKLAEIDLEQITSELTRLSTATNSQASAESIPGNTPSASST
jgi:isopropylmalate/homocitrate/citramalate synthase